MGGDVFEDGGELVGVLPGPGRVGADGVGSRGLQLLPSGPCLQGPAGRVHAEWPANAVRDYSGVFHGV